MEIEVLRRETKFSLRTNFPGIGSKEYPFDYDTFEAALNSATNISKQGHGYKVRIVMLVTEVTHYEVHTTYP